MRSRFLIMLLVVAAGVSGKAEAANSNQTINIQGVIRDSAGNLQTMAVGLTVNLYTSATATTPFYTQSFPTVAVDNGFFSVELAGSSLNFSTADAWFGVQVSGDPVELPRQHFAAVPYAFNAASADSLSAAAAAKYQQVLTTSDCGGGKYIQAISATGAVTCGSVPASVTAVTASAPLTASTGTTPNIALPAGSLAHSHPTNITLGGTSGNLSVAAGATTTLCSACGASSRAIGGSCYVVSGSMYLVSATLGEAVPFGATNSWCCTYANVGSATGSAGVLPTCLTIGSTSIP